MEGTKQFPYEIRDVEQSEADQLMKYFTVSLSKTVVLGTMEGKKQFPYEIRDVEQSEADELTKYFTGEYSGFVRVGPKGYFFPQKYKEQAGHIYNLPLKSDDVFFASYPRSGSTWIRELVWMVANDLNYAESSAVPLVKRFALLEFSMLIHPKTKDQLLKENDVVNKKLIELFATPGYDRLASNPCPRYIFTHLPLSLLPPALLQTSKMVYLARDPRDVVVSFYHLNRLHRALGYVGDFKTFWNFFITDRVYWTPFFENLKEAWANRLHPNMVFLFYEEVVKDLPSAIHRISGFLNKQYSDEQVAGLCDHLSIDNFRKNKSVNYDVMKDLGVLVEGEQSYIRKGKPGGWRDCFTEEMRQQADSWIEENLRDTDLRFPTIASK